MIRTDFIFRILSFVSLLAAIAVNVAAQEAPPQELRRQELKQEEAPQEDTQEDMAGEDIPGETYEFPHIKPKLFTFAGYRFMSTSGSRRAFEYEDPQSSIALGGGVHVFSFPHRLDLDVDRKSNKDYSGEADYAYKDIIFLRGVDRTLFHNLENIGLVDLDKATPSPGVDIRDADRKYGVKDSMNNLLLRLKMPDFPAHFYIDGALSEKKGVQQQRSLTGSGWFNDIVRTSRERNIDWHTRSITIGANSHLGSIEMDVSHSEKRFDVSGDNVFYDNYTATDSAPPRAAGRYPNSLIPELKESSNTLKVHTVYTGGLVATGTLSQTNKENRDSGAKADYFIGAAEVIWMPVTKLTFFLKYRHKEVDSDTPGTVTLSDVSNPLNSYVYQVKHPLSSRTDMASWAVRYRLLSNLTLKGEYSYEDIKRNNAAEWSLPGSTQRHIVSLSADSRLFRVLGVKAAYTHKDIKDPAYNTEPDRSDEGKISLTWTPLQRITTLLSYSLAREKRNNLQFLDFPGNIISAPNDRTVHKDKVFGNITFLLSRKVILNTSYVYIHTNTKQDIVYLFAIPPPSYVSNIDALVPYGDNAHSYAVNVNYAPKENISVSAGVSHTTSSGGFSPGASDLTAPVSIASFSSLKTRETIYSLSGEYRFREGLSLGVNCRYSDFKDVLDNPYDDMKDGHARILLLTIAKRW
ncbi:MAG TPA: hypothetical protein VF790_12050 [Dissulfurispiraceae bacterium]